MLVRSTLIIAVFFSLANYSFTPIRMSVNKHQDPIDNFWSWFAANEQRLRKFEESPTQYLTEILNQAKVISRGLTIELEPPKNGIINMTVSADGDKELFEMVMQIVKKAPKLTGWKFIAFRQRVPAEIIKGARLKIQGRIISPDKMLFFPLIAGDKLDIIVYLEGVTKENYEEVAYGTLLFLDNLLGEYDCVIKVRSYDFHNMPTNAKDLEGLKSIFELPEYVDKFYASKKQ